MHNTKHPEVLKARWSSGTAPVACSSPPDGFGLRSRGGPATTSRWRRWRWLVAVCSAIGMAGIANAQNVVQSYFVPFGEDDVHLALHTIDDFAGNIGGTMRSTISIVAGVTNTIIFYDHWEDGYEDQISAPTQSTTEVWGDWNSTNGIPPDYANDAVDAGSIITLLTDIPVPRDPDNIMFDGRDKFSVNKPVAISRAMYAVSPGEVLAGSAQVLDVGQHGFTHRAPIGVNTGTNEMFEFSTILVMAGHDSTVVEIDADNDGAFEETVFLNEGETHTIRQIVAGATVKASKPVQAHMITGDIGSNYEMRWFTLFPQNQWHHSYYTPVGSSANTPAEVHLFNPHTNSITVHYEMLNETGAVVVAEGAVGSVIMPQASGGHFYTTNHAFFLPVETKDANQPISQNQAYDWGHGMVSDKALTTMSLVPWGPGSGGAPITANGNPVWVTTLSNTTLYIDYDGEPSTGPLVDPSGQNYDLATNIVRMSSLRIFDTNDLDQTGMRIYTLDGTPITTAWGQDPEASEPGNPFLDMGSAILPFQTIPAVKKATLHTDLATNNVANPGDSLKFTIHVQNVGFADATDVYVFDSGASNTTYQLESTAMNEESVADDSVPPAATAFPLDEQGFNVGELAVGETSVVEYIVTINDPFPTNADGVINGVFVEQEQKVFVPVPQHGFTIAKSSNPTNPLSPGATISYTISVHSTSTVEQAGVRVSDPLPAHTYWVTNSTRVEVPGPFSGSLRDQFTTDGEFDGSEGALLWLDEWQQEGEADGADMGNIQITTDSGAPGEVHMLMVQNGNQGAYRRADIGAFTSAVLQFDFRRDALESASEYVAVYASTNGGGAWSELGRIEGSGTDNQYISTNYDVTAYASTNFAVRFFASSDMSTADRIWFDNVDIAVQGSGVTNRGGAPSLLLDHYVLGTNESLEVTFDVVVEDSITVSQVVNEASVVSFNSPEPLSSVVTNTVVLPDPSDISGQVRDDLDGDGDLAENDPGLSGVSVTLFSDPNGDGSADDGTSLETLVTDASGHYVFAGYLPNDYVIVEMDPPHYASTADRDGANFNVIALATTSGVHSTGNDFLDSQRAGISGQVRLDQDGDGNLADPDPGIASVTLQLYTDPDGDGDPADGSLETSGTTDGAGQYTFNAVGTGTYVVVETDLSGYISMADSEGTNDNRIAVSMPGGVASSGNDFLDALGGISITKESSPDGIWFLDLEASYTITILNTGMFTHTAVDVTDTLSAGLAYTTNSTWIDASSTETNTIRDLFGTVAYSNQDGTENWESDWVEVDSAGSGPSAGAVQITGGQLRLTDGVSGTPSIERQANLTQSASATLRFDYDTSTAVDADDEVALQVSANGTDWTTLELFTGEVAGSASHDISAYMTANTYIRFVVTVLYGGSDEYFFIDNVEIERLEDTTVASAGNPPPTLLSGYTLNPGDSLQITFTGIVTGADAITNEACFTSSLLPGGLCDSVVNSVDTSATPHRITGQVRNDLDGDGNLADPDPGIGGVTIRLHSDPNGDGDPADGETLDTKTTDADGHYIFGSLSNASYVVEETDLTAYSSTADTEGTNDNRIAVTLLDGDSTGNDFLDMTISGLAISKTVTPPETLDPGQVIEYSVLVTNVRPFAQAGVTISDPLPEGLTYMPTSTWFTALSAAISHSARDEFTTVAYTNNDGIIDWSGNWIEWNDDSSPTGGDILFIEDLGNQRLRIRDDDNAISRAADLTGYQSATLRMDYRREGLEAGEYVAVQISNNFSEAWEELDRFGNDGSSSTTDGAFISTNYNLSGYIASNITIRFATPDGGMSNGDVIYLDNVEVEATKGGVLTNTGGPPPLLISDYTIPSGGFIRVSFTATVGFVDEIINTACVTTPSDTNGLCASVTNEVVMLSVTQAMAGVDSNPDAIFIAWRAATNLLGVDKSYDLLFVDDGHIGFSPALTSQWQWATTVTNSFAVDTGGPNRPSPMNLGHQMRFYRAAREGRWTPDKSFRVASEEIYVAKCIHLEEGENWVSLFMEPDSNTVSRVLGTQLPSGSQFSEATSIEWYGTTQSGVATNMIWLADNGTWLYGSGGVADEMPLPLNQGFNINIPAGAGSQKLLVVGRLPQAINAEHGHVHLLAPAGKYNVVSYNLPYRVTLGNSGLREAGFTGTPPGQQVNPSNSDEIRILKRGGGSLAAPRIRILMNGAGQFVYWEGGPYLQSAENYRFDVDDAIIVYTRRSETNLNWTLELPYPLPTATMNP